MELFTASFPYQPLRGSQAATRLMILEPGNFDDPIQCKLQHADLNSGCFYEALSYAWGNPKATTLIKLDNQSFPVTTNLERALRYIRKPDSQRTIWVDAVCIDQRNELERNTQVQLMGQIYKSASKVHLWVGEDGIQNPIYPSTIPIQQLFRILRHIYKGRALDSELMALNITYASWSYSILDFIGRDYFRRLWIVQEASANSETELVCGKFKMPWVKVQVSLETIFKYMKDMDMTDFTSEPLLSHFHHVLCLGDTWFNWGAFSKLQVSRTADTKDPTTLAQRIFKVLYRLDGQFQSRDLKDRLFAILSMVSSSQDTLVELGLNVDYRKNAGQVFHELAVFLLKHRKSLDILTHCETDTSHQTELGEVPSWVPTWGPSPSASVRRIATMRQSVSDTYFRLSKDNRALVLRGVVYDSIAFVGDEVTFDLAAHPQNALRGHDVYILKAKLSAFQDQVLGHPLVQNKYNNDSNAAKELLKHTLLHPSDKEQMDAEHAYYDALTQEEDSDGSLLEVELTRTFTTSTARGSRSSRWKLQELMNKRPFITSGGHIGIAEGCRGLKVNDSVCLFRGATVPFIMRKQEDHYVFLGACYVHNIMALTEQHKLIRRWKCAEFPIR